MKAVAAIAPGRVEIVEIPLPEIHDYECLVKMKACGLCNGTDLKIIDDEVSKTPVEFPVILGHEGVGEVVQVGEKVKNIHMGEVYLNPDGRIMPGTPFKSMWANMAEYGVLPDYRVMDELGIGGPRYGGSLPIPPEIDPVDGGVILTLKECLSAIRNFGFQKGQAVLVYGDGPVGLALVNFLRREGAAWIGCVGHRPQRLEWIAGHSQPDLLLNAHRESVPERLTGRCLDFVIDAVGSTAVIREASHLLKPGGTVGVLGVIKNKDASLSLLDLANHSSVHMLNWPYREHTTHEEIIGLILQGKIKPRDYYNHVMPMEEASRAVEMIKTREAFKVVLKI